MTLRVRERWTTEGRSHNYGFSPKSLLKGAVGFKEKLNGYPKPFFMVVHTPIVSWWPPRGGLDSEFPSPRTPAHGRQCLALCGRYAWQFNPWLLIGFSPLSYVHTHAHTRTYTCIHMYIYIRVHTYAHPLALRHLQMRHTVGASYLLRP